MNCRQASHHYNSSFPYLGSGTNTSCLAGWWRSQVKPKADHFPAVAAAVVWGRGGLQNGKGRKGASSH